MRLFAALRKDPRVERVQCLPGLMDRPDGLRYLPLLPPAVRRTLEASDGSATLFEVIPAARLTPREQISLARELRTWNAADVTGLPGVRMSVGGQPGFDADYEDTVARHFRRVILLVVGGTFLALFAGFRSLLVAIKAVLLNLLSVGAAFGALVLVFQEGHGASAARALRADGKRLPDHPGDRLLHRVRPLDGLRGDPRGPRGRGAARRARRVAGDRRGPRAHGDRHHERRGDHDRRLLRASRSATSCPSRCSASRCRSPS